MTPSPGTPFFESGTVTDHINVEISFQIIGLFSEGLYSSPNKAVEELVSNAFDADATCVHTVMSPDRAASDASIAILDNGTGMDATGLKVHWIVGDSVKAGNRTTARGRRTIGKFGIGKLAAYVLGTRLTHITKSDGRFFSTTMDFMVRLAPIKRVNLAKMRELLATCQSPADVEQWVDAVALSQPDSSPHQQILETVWELQQDDRDHTVEYAALRTALRLSKNLTITDAELREECLALSRMAPGYFMAREDRVELNIKPENVLATIHAYVDDLPQADEEQA